jgi:peptidase E
VTGLLALLGGGEHTVGCEAVDAHLLTQVDSPRPVVTIVPLAAGPRARARTVSLAVTWWKQLGATVVVAPRAINGALQAVDEADIVVLPGGMPDRLHGRLVGTPLWHRIVDRWRQGTHVSGSSSGAMVLGRWRQSVLPPFALQTGFDLVPSVAVAPHYDQPVPRAFAAWRARTHPRLTIVGIDERTALVGREGSFRVFGVGGVTVRRHLALQTWQAGEGLVLSDVLGQPVQSNRERFTSGPRALDPSTPPGTLAYPVYDDPDEGLADGALS